MNPIPFKLAVAMALASAVIGVTAPLLASAQASKEGWWIRVDAKKTEATGIGLELGTGKQDRHAWKTWRPNDAVEFDLPADFAARPRIHLRAVAIPDDEDVWFCVFYKGNGVRRFDFDTTEEATMQQTDRDSHCH